MEKVTRILHVAAVQFTATNLLSPQLEFLSEKGFEVHLAFRPDHDVFPPELAKFSPTALSFSRSGNVSMMAKGTLDLLRLVKRLRPEIVHLHSPATALPGRVGLALRSYGAKVVYTVHGFPQAWDVMTSKDKALDRIEKTLSRVTDLTMFQAIEDLEQARSRNYKSCLTYLGNGVGDEWFDDGNSYRKQDDETLQLVFVGRLVREKGVLELVEAVAGLPNVELSVIGDSLASDRDSVSTQVSEMASQLNGRVKLLGMLSSSEIREIHRSHDCFVLPSWREGVPRSLIEAMAQGLPAIATDIRGCRELIRPGIDGWLTTAKSVPSLASAIAGASLLPKAELRMLGTSAFERASTTYRESLVFERLLVGYAELGVTP
jgi:glycosyltransferase involved in cell wall biosynthesis